MRLLRRFFLFAAVLVVLPAAGAEVRVMISAGFFGVYSELLPGFEKATGHKVVTVRGPSMGDSPEAIPTRLSKGEHADLVIMDGHGADKLVQAGMVQPEPALLAISQVGMVVKEGAPKPDISTPEAFRRVLAEAKSIAYSDSGSGTWLSTTLFPRIDPGLNAKSRKVRGPPSGEPVAAVIARGEAEIGFQQVSELIHTKGVTYVGPIPAELQPGFSFKGGITKQAKEPGAAKALVDYLTAKEAAPVVTRMGLAPPR